MACAAALLLQGTHVAGPDHAEMRQVCAWQNQQSRASILVMLAAIHFGRSNAIPKLRCNEITKPCCGQIHYNVRPEGKADGMLSIEKMLYQLSEEQNITLSDSEVIPLMFLVPTRGASDSSGSG